MYKTAFNYALKSGLIDKNPFDLYEGKVVETDAVYLTPEELKTIETTEITAGRLVKTKDIFIFCCYTGYAPADASALKDENLVSDNNDDFWILANRTKTSMHENVPLLPPANRIINKYRKLQPTLLPSISNQKMNEYLKEIAVLCGIKKKTDLVYGTPHFCHNCNFGKRHQNRKRLLNDGTRKYPADAALCQSAGHKYQRRYEKTNGQV